MIGKNRLKNIFGRRQFLSGSQPGRLQRRSWCQFEPARLDCLSIGQSSWPNPRNLIHSFRALKQIDATQISTGGGFFDVRGVTIPVAVSTFPDEIYTAARSWAERAYPKLIYYNKLDKGGHFAAWEQPALFCSEMRAAFRSLRPSI